MKKFLLNLSIKQKVVIISTITIVLISGVGIFACNKLNNETTAVNANNNNLALEEEVVPVIKEEVIQVAKDNSIDEALQSSEDELDIADKKIAVPKSKVAPVNSAEDPEKNKKKGGAAVNQDDVSTMFQNVGTKSFGIDVSAHQGRIDWAAVKASGVDFAMIRCGFRGYSEGGIYEDAYFKRNVSGAISNGIKVGIYFYSAAINENEALEEAAWVISKIKTYRITYPVVYDFEDFQRYRCANVDGAQATRNAITFLNLVSQAGYEPMMYANKSDITTRMSRGSFGCKFWLAHYTSQTDYTGSYQMWQYTSKGSVNGISGNVDMNIAYFSYGSTADAKHTHNYTETVKNSVKQATCSKEGSKTVRCSCGETKTEVIPKLSHKFGAWEVTKPATEKEEGLKVRKCSVCKAEETEKISKLKPNTNTNTSTNTGKDNTTVDNTNTPHEHSYTEDVSKRVEPTCANEGSKTLTCSCGHIKTEKIPATDNHNYVDGKCSVCGKDNPDYVKPTEPNESTTPPTE